jgi:hypothetical protein
MREHTAASAQVGTLALAVLIALAADARAGQPSFRWQKTDTSVALLNGDHPVWEHHHDKAVGKPHMRICLVDGTELTRPWPMPKDYKGYDHTWHKALWWSWKYINKTNFWEGNHKGTEPVKAEVATSEDFSARIALDIHYRLPQAQPVLTETRTIAVSAPNPEGCYHIDWAALFTAGDKDVTLNKNWYGGMAARMAKRTIKWEFRDSEGRQGANGCSRKRSRWIDFSGKLPDGREAGVAIFVHRDNPRQPPPWCVIQGMPYFNPAFTGSEDYTLPAGKTLLLRYRILIHPGLMTPEQLEADSKAFSEAASKGK